jgi:hypothetical protein
MALLERSIASLRFTAANERGLQDGLAEHLSSVAPHCFAREYSLGPKDRPDFFSLAHGIAIEVKWGVSGGSVPKIVAQLLRYAEHPSVRGVILCTPSRRVLSAVPTEVRGIPVTGVALRTGF